MHQSRTFLLCSLERGSSSNSSCCRRGFSCLLILLLKKFNLQTYVVFGVSFYVFTYLYLKVLGTNILYACVATKIVLHKNECIDSK